MKILIPLDGSSFAGEVLEPIAGLAVPLGAEVHLVEVVMESTLHTTWAKPPSAVHMLESSVDFSGATFPGTDENPEVVGVKAETMHQYYIFFGLIRLNEVDIQRVVGDYTSYDVDIGFAYRDGFWTWDSLGDFMISMLFLPLTVTRQAVTVKY